VLNTDCKDPGKPICDANVCTAGCKVDGDCPYLNQVCNVATGKCAECFSSTDCKDPLLAHCFLQSNICVQCLGNADCTTMPGQPFCDMELNVCQECVTDANCSDPGKPYCYYAACKAKCTSTADCLSPDKCDVPTGRCGECFTQADCANHPNALNCDLTKHKCVP